MTFDPNASVNAEAASPSSSRHRPRGYDLWRDMTMTRSRDMFSPVTEFYDWTPTLLLCFVVRTSLVLCRIQHIITTFAVCVTVNLEKSFSFDTTFKITSCILLQFVC